MSLPRTTKCCCPELRLYVGLLPLSQIPRRASTLRGIFPSAFPGVASDICAKSRLTLVRQLRIMQSNQAKPMSKRSTWSGSLSESCGWWDRSGELSSEWACEGSANRPVAPVASDGIRARYQGGAYGCTRSERALCVNLGGTAGWFQVLSQIWGRAFFDSIFIFRKGALQYEAVYQTMARPAPWSNFAEAFPSQNFL